MFEKKNDCAKEAWPATGSMPKASVDDDERNRRNSPESLRDPSARPAPIRSAFACLLAIRHRESGRGRAAAIDGEPGVVTRLAMPASVWGIDGGERDASTPIVIRFGASHGG